MCSQGVSLVSEMLVDVAAQPELHEHAAWLKSLWSWWAQPCLAPASHW